MLLAGETKHETNILLAFCSNPRPPHPHKLKAIRRKVKYNRNNIQNIPCTEMTTLSHVY